MHGITLLSRPMSLGLLDIALRLFGAFKGPLDGAATAEGECLHTRCPGGTFGRGLIPTMTCECSTCSRGQGAGEGWGFLVARRGGGYGLSF